MAALNKIDEIKHAFRCGPIPVIKNWRRKKLINLSRAERVMSFIETYLRVPEGRLVGKPIRLDLFQQAFLYAIYDNKQITRQAFLSIARKNGKTALIAAIMLAHIIGPEARRNTQVRSGARSKEQAALVFDQASKMLKLNPELSGLYNIVPSTKVINGLNLNVDYKAISAESSTAHGSSPVLAILDEVGQIKGPVDPFFDAVTTAQGAHENPLLIIISTSASADSDLFSVICDDAERSQDPHTVYHCYAADDDCELMDRNQWKKANPALGTFRNEKDLEEQLKQAQRLPSQEASKRNLLLNNRISLVSMWLAPSIWKSNSKKPDFQVFKDKGVNIGLDLSKRNDLTCAVISAEDDQSNIHVFPYAFTPINGVKERSRRDRVPYDEWVRDGVLIGVAGSTIDYDWVAEYLRLELEKAEIEIHSIEFDRWRIKEFQGACERSGFASYSVFNEVGQGYKDQSPRIEAMETALLQNRIRHGNHPVFNLGASSAIVLKDPSGNQKLDKAKSSNKIDAIVAMVMSVYPLLGKLDNNDFDVAALVG